mmetsp:Transcript_4742/g.11995  ORF Transcript_4742/g.11995 Transcript_4742/m.11995 type:complete len:586 (+) Transcript_4742:46-1803(+)
MPRQYPSGDADLRETDEDGNERFLSMAPLSVRGPFSVIDSFREHASKDRLRYRMDGFNLDLRYITPNLVAMAAPSDRGMSKMVSNHVDEVVRFFRLKHDSKAMFFNLIGEAKSWEFDAHRLGVVNHQFAFLDHSVPTLNHMQAFCLAVKQWLEQDPGNVAVIMCKSGRNRTAIMACAYLLFRWPNEFSTAQEAMDHFAHRRLREGPAVTVPSQRRWISYFSQRFAAVPQTIKLSKIVVPHAPLKSSKLRLDIMRLVQGSPKGDAMDEELVWTSKGKSMGRVLSGETYVVFAFPHTLGVTGDIKLVVSGRKYSNGPFTTHFWLWLNTGFIDHTPMVWDKSCLDGLSHASRGDLPDDFHIQTLFVGQPRVACSNSKIKPARIYCWDCDDPFMGEEESVTLHRARTMIGPDGEEEEVRTGPPHRFHPLIEEECALCEQRRLGYDGKDEHGIVNRDKSMLHERTMSVMEYRSRHHQEQTKSAVGERMDLSSDTQVYSTEEGLKLTLAKKKIEAREKEKERQMYAGKRKEKEAAPMHNSPTVLCEDTRQYLCSWCNRHALGPKGKGYTRISIPLIPSSQMRYSGCARQVC